MEIATGCSTKTNEKEAVREAYTQLSNKIDKPSFIFVLSTVAYDSKVILSELKNLSAASNAKIMGGTSCLGIITEKGFCSDDKHALGLFAIQDDAGCYGVAALPLSDNPKQDGQKVIRKALENAERPGELPNIIILTSAPGHEEDLINGMMTVVGKDVPIFGGTSADNTISGQWQQFCGDEITQNGVAVVAIYTDEPIGYAFHNGYAPTEHVGIVTKAQGRRVSSIDNRPAAEVYNQWTGGVIQSVLGTDANILSLSTLYPLGREIGKIGEIPYYNLSHPNEIFADGSMNFFSNIQEKEKVVLMTGTKQSLKTRIKRVISLAKENYLSSSGAKPKGAFIIYCAGCFLAIQEDIQEVVDGIHSELPSEPFIGMFSFGEQGCLFGGENRHGNLMISAIIFG